MFLENKCYDNVSVHFKMILDQNKILFNIYLILFFMNMDFKF